MGEFDLETDPDERTPLPPGPLTEAARAAAASFPTGPATDVNREALRRLGYLE